MRYRDAEGVDGLPPGEGVFLACSFWLVEVLAMQGKKDEANELFNRLLSLRNDLGLLSEEYDPVSRRPTWQFPAGLQSPGAGRGGAEWRAYDARGRSGIAAEFKPISQANQVRCTRSALRVTSCSAAPTCQGHLRGASDQRRAGGTHWHHMQKSGPGRWRR